ncbi:MAG: PIN domain-containing protein [Propionibacteriaceae bacterium]|jgi:predicted nucleic acid-binding protein|nr:PIN domain-containing protein [Propionibacteriaceae bacterium]
MPSADLLLDTSCAVALLSPDHRAHDLVEAYCEGKTLGLSGHALFETYAVLTRTPNLKVSPADAAALIDDNFTANAYLSAPRAARLPAELAQADIGGGSVYDALVGAAAAEAGIALLTLDARAERVYAALGVAHVTLRQPD